jgi:hypothetical protein
MRRQFSTVTCICGALLATLLAAGTTARAQSANTAAPSAAPSDSSKPATASTAGEAKTAPVTAPSAPAKPAAAKKPKKVWTNDEIGSVGGTISVVGDASRQNSAPRGADAGASPNSASSGRQRQLDAYRRQIRQLQAQIDAADAKINELRNFKGENTAASDGIVLHQRYSMTPIADQIQQQEDKKKKLQAQIDAIEDSARKDGFDPGELR